MLLKGGGGGSISDGLRDSLLSLLPKPGALQQTPKDILHMLFFFFYGGSFDKMTVFEALGMRAFCLPHCILEKNVQLISSES